MRFWILIFGEFYTWKCQKISKIQSCQNGSCGVIQQLDHNWFHVTSEWRKNPDISTVCCSNYLPWSFWQKLRLWPFFNFHTMYLCNWEECGTIVWEVNRFHENFAKDCYLIDIFVRFAKMVFLSKESKWWGLRPGC